MDQSRYVAIKICGGKISFGHGDGLMCIPLRGLSMWQEYNEENLNEKVPFIERIVLFEAHLSEKTPQQ